MTNKEKILALLKLAGNKIEGRTKFQKLIYILKNHGVDFSEKFKYHHYGPYSLDLQLEIEELVDSGEIKETSANPYVYKLDPKVVDNIDNTMLRGKKSLVERLNSQDYRVLELIATIYYLKNNGINNDLALKNKLMILKPHLESKIEEAFNVFKDLETIRDRH